MSWALRTEGLGKTFTLHLQGGAVIPVLRDVELEVAAGELVALSGPSGAGKSTLMRVLYGNYGAASGRVLLRHGNEVVDLATADARLVRAVRRDTLGHVAQFLRAIPRVPARDIVAEPLVARGLTWAEARARATDMLLRLALPERLHDLPPATFSGGEQQRVNLARGLLPGYSVLLLDEPTASLDAANRDRVAALIEAARDAGAAIVAILHDTALRDRVSTRSFEVLPMRAAA